MTDILVALHKYLWAMDFFALCIFVFLAVKHKQLSSSLLALIITVLMSGVVVQYEAFVKAIEIPGKNHDSFCYQSTNRLD